MRFTEIIAIVVLIILLTGSTSEMFSDKIVNNYDILLNSASYVPEEEAYIHIAGGFFSVFEGKGGIIINSENQINMGLPKAQETFTYTESNCGYIKMKLHRLEYTSRFVYRPEGNLIIQIPGQESMCFSMEKLDYVDVTGSLEPCYRLSGSLLDCEGTENNLIKAQLICFAVGGSNPVLCGGLYLTDTSGKVVCYPIRISGRRGNEADNHLHKVIAKVSHFTF
jgi:hypothetical protein